MTENAPLRYAQRAKPFARLVSFRLDPQHLFVDDGKSERRISYAEIMQIRLAFEPKNFTLRGFRATLTLRSGKTVSLTNLDWKTYFQFEHQNDFRPFVMALVEHAGRANPHLLCVAGRPIAIWALSALLGLLTTLTMAWSVLFAWQHDARAYALIAAFLLFAFARLGYELFRRNKPTLFTSDSIPERVLPSA
jgi:hypothetical protein